MRIHRIITMQITLMKKSIYDHKVHIFRYFYIGVLTCCCLFIASCDDTVSDASLYSKRLHTALESAVTANKGPGGVLMVRFTDGSRWSGAYGKAFLDETAPRAMNTTDRFRIGSVTKTFIGTAILQLVKDGLINLDDTVEILLPGTYSHGNEVTVRQLLNHSSAIPNYTNVDAFEDIYYSNNPADREHVWTHEELITLIDNEDLLDVPGREGYYSNTNFILLGMIIEKFTGTTIDQYLYHNIFVPLGLENTYFPTQTAIVGTHTDGYFDFNENGKFEADEMTTDQSPTAIWAAGAIISTPDDLLTWLDELMTGTLLTSELQNIRMQMTIPYHDAPAGVDLGLAVANILGPVGHTGAVIGYTTYMFRYQDVDFVTYANGFHSTNSSDDIAKAIFENAKNVVFGDN